MFFAMQYGKVGVWCVYDYNPAPVAISIHVSATKSLIALANNHGAQVCLWPLDMTLREAIEWFNAERQKEMAAANEQRST